MIVRNYRDSGTIMGSMRMTQKKQEPTLAKSGAKQRPTGSRSFKVNGKAQFSFTESPLVTETSLAAQKRCCFLSFLSGSGRV